MKIPTSVILAVVLVFTSSVNCRARFARPRMIPVDRLVKNVEALLATNQADASTHYTLARIHYLAFVIQRDRVPACSSREKDVERWSAATSWIRGWSILDQLDKSESLQLPRVQILEHASKAQQCFTEALRLDPTNGLYQLGLASFLEEFGRWCVKDRPQDLPANLHLITNEELRAAYGKAFSLAMSNEPGREYLPIDGIQGITAYEAAAAYVRFSNITRNDVPAEERPHVLEARKAMVRFEKLPRGAVTPIVFSFQPAAHLEELLDPDTVVDFDLRGYGVRERWPWIKPELGLLIWDPEQTGAIESARQLFGGYTFQIFWKTGYDALAALDDNGDGALSGPELDGISVWFDRNGDGRSTADEVTPVRDLGVMSIATRAPSRDGRHPTNERGLTLRDGRVLRTWDWIVDPLPPENVSHETEGRIRAGPFGASHFSRHRAHSSEPAHRGNFCPTARGKVNRG